MADLYFPSSARVSSSQWELADNAGRFISPLSGVNRVVARTGDRWRVTLNLLNQDSASASRRAMQSFLLALRGGVNSVWLQDHSYTQSGSFPATELLTNNTFANGTTGWTVSGGTLTTPDRMGRLTASTGGGSNPTIYQTIGLTQYAPHILRSMILDGAQSSGLSFGPAINDSVQTQINDYSTSRGLRAAVMVAVSASAAEQYSLVFASATGFTAGAYVEMPWASLSRCALVDNGPNAVTYSDQLNNAAWAKTAVSISTDAAASPDGTTTADAIVEDGTLNYHFIQPTPLPTRASAAEDLCSYGYFKRGSGTRNIRLDIGANNSTDYSSCTFNLGSGTAGSVSNAGSNTNGRAFITSAGNGWYFCILIARTIASTTIYSAHLLDNAGSVNYTGNGTSSVYGWRFGSCRGAVPTHGGQTVATAAASGTLQALAGGLYTKGWPVSTNGLLLPGDQVQIGTQLLIVTAPVNSDAAGLAFLQTSPSLRTAPADNAPVIINQPMGKFMLPNNVQGWSSRPGTFSDATIELEEDMR